jgi:SAM-dependent methyltransferase
MTKSYKKTIYEALGRDPVHPFPARMAPGIALDIIEAETEAIRVLDPMMGSGTVLALARAHGHKAIGVDIDPLAVLLARVWTTAVSVPAVEDKAAEVLARARADFPSRRVGNAYPFFADEETRRFIRYWFDGYARRQLACLSDAIHRVRHDTVRDTLWCAFSRLIITKQAGASLAMDLSHSRPHRAFTHAPVKPFRKFLTAVNHVVKNCISADQENRGPTTTIQNGDARRLEVRSNSIDLILTSPPYLNAIDYMRCSKFSLVWMGYNVGELGRIRTASVGSEAGSPEARDDPFVRQIIAALHLRPNLSARHEAVLAHYIEDIRQSIQEAARVLIPGGKAVYVVGENTVRGTYIPNSRIVTAVAEISGLEAENRKSRALPANRRYLPPPSNGNKLAAALDGRMRREVILSFSKPNCPRV